MSTTDPLQDAAEFGDGAAPVRWQIAISKLLEGKLKSEVCREMEIHRDTLLRWEKNPAFQEFYEAAKEERRAALRSKFEAAGDVGFKALMDVAENGENESARVAAAKELVARSLGASPQKVEVTTPQGIRVDLPYADEIAALRARLTT